MPAVASRRHRRAPALRGAVLAALCGLAPQARAAADDINAQPAMSAGLGAVVLAAGRRLANEVVETEQAVVRAVEANAASPWVAPGWRPSADAPIAAGRAVDEATRAAAAALARDSGNSAAAQAADATDLSFGARLRVLRGDADLHIPLVSWMAEAQPTLGGSPNGAAALRPSTHLSAEWPLPGDFSLGVMPGMAVDLDATGRRTANGTLAVTLGKAWSAQWRTFVDMARDRLAVVQPGGVSTTVDAGLSFAAGPATQLDVAITHGLSPSAPPFLAGVGVSSSF